MAGTEASPDIAFSQGDGRWMDCAPRPQGHSGASDAFRKSSNSREQRAGRRPGLRHSGKATGIQNSSPSRARTGPKWAKGPLLSGEGRTPGHWGASASWSCGVSPLPPERKAGWRGVRGTPGAEGSCPRQATAAGPGSENAGPADSPAHPKGARSLPVIRASLPFTPSRHLTETMHSEDDLQPETVLGPAPIEGTGPRG